MHTFIYPSKNSYITNENGYESSNFSLDSTLEIKSINTFVPVYNNYITQSVSASVSCDTKLYGFIGDVIGGLNGYASNAVVYVSGTGSFNTDNFSGSYNSTGYDGYSGSLSGSLINGIVSGIFSGSVDYISGSISNFTGSLYSGSSYSGITHIYSPYTTYNIISTISRALMQFDVNIISQSISNGDIENSASLKYYLTLKNAHANELPLSYNIIAYPLTQDWSIGDGRYQLGGSATGVSWIYTDNYNGNIWNNYGGDFDNTISASQSFNHSDSDIKMDITNIVNKWINGDISNYGVILLTSLESSSIASNNSLRFFSTETNTIYSPYLDTYWDDSVYSTGSLLPSTFPYTIVLQNVKKEYKFGSIPRINIFSRPQTPLKNFTKGLQLNYYLTSSYLAPSYYMIKDNESEEVLIDFDEGSKLSCDGNMNYFILDTTALPQERYYKILIKTVEVDGEVNIFDNKNIFKIVR
jgi:hypothetical protein